MSNPFFDHPILNSPYKSPTKYWELDESGQPTQKSLEGRRPAKFITPIPKPKNKNQIELTWFLVPLQKRGFLLIFTLKEC